MSEPVFHPDSNPFDSAIDNPNLSADLRAAAYDVSDVIDISKRILLQHKVRNFEASDVVNVARMVIERSVALSDGGVQE